MLTELSVMLKQQKQFFEELEKRVAAVASLEVIGYPASLTHLK